MTEDYVSFETAKLLKEKGFDGMCYKVWESHDKGKPNLVAAPWFVEGETAVNREAVDAAAKQYVYDYSIDNKVEGYLAPTLQMAMKWLREVHQIHIEIGFNERYFPVCISTLTNDTIPYIAMQGKPFKYEEVCEAAIKYCLENLV